MKRIMIHVGGSKPIALKDALALMTDDWIDEGHHSPQTVIDLRDAIVQLRATRRKPAHRKGRR